MTKAKKSKSTRVTTPGNPARISRAQERKWRAQDDARTLAQAKTIMSDKSRMSAARKEAKTMYREKQKEAVALKRVAGKK